MMKIHTPSAYGLGILAGLESLGTYDNPYDDYYDPYEHKKWNEGYEKGEALYALIAVKA